MDFSSVPCHQKTYDNEETVMRMVQEQEYLAIPTELIPYCPKCGKPMSMYLHCDQAFVQDSGWYSAAMRYEDDIRRHAESKILYLELGVGGNTPGIIKYPFWKMTAANSSAVYACVNLGEAVCPKVINKRSICIDADIGQLMDSYRELPKI